MRHRTTSAKLRQRVIHFPREWLSGECIDLNKGFVVCRARCCFDLHRPDRWRWAPTHASEDPLQEFRWTRHGRRPEPARTC
jgi:hypothetical protein